MKTVSFNLIKWNQMKCYWEWYEFELFSWFVYMSKNDSHHFYLKRNNNWDLISWTAKIKMKITMKVQIENKNKWIQKKFKK